MAASFILGQFVDAESGEASGGLIGGVFQYWDWISGEYQSKCSIAYWISTASPKSFMRWTYESHCERWRKSLFIFMLKRSWNVLYRILFPNSLQNLVSCCNLCVWHTEHQIDPHYEHQIDPHYKKLISNVWMERYDFWSVGICGMPSLEAAGALCS